MTRVNDAPTRRITSLAVALAVMTTTPAWSADKVTLSRLLDEMTDLRHLAEFPDPPFVTKQFSSYDRSSDNPADAATWHANHDRGHPLYDGVLDAESPFFKSGPMQGRPPDGRFPAGARVGIARHRPAIGNFVWAYATGADGGPIDGKILQGYVDRAAIRMNPDGPVLAEMDGPGCLVRIWSANPAEAGQVRIYLDRAKSPVISAKLQELLGGTWETEFDGKKLIPFPKAFAGERGRGWNFYYPIPFAKHCRVVAEKGDVAYQITYRQYAMEVDVTTFDWAEVVDVSEKRQRIQRQLEARVPLFSTEASETKNRESRLEPGQQVEIFNLEGSGAVQQFRLRIQAERMPEALRSLVLVGRFDDAPAPQVECPVGDFFGTSPGLNSYTSFPFSVLNDGNLTCNWTMPYARRARFELHNHGRQSITTTASASIIDYAWTPGSMHFHAKWRLLHPLSARPMRDELIAKLDGRGVFVGQMLSVMNSVSAWWGEGDQRIYVDGDKFPSLHGTGTDDDFGLAWRDPTPFQHAYHNQTRCDGPGNFGHTSLNRFLVLDRIPFAKQLRYDLEITPWEPKAALSLATTCYWYARHGSTDKFPPIAAPQVQELPSPPPIHRVAGALEGENLRVLRKSAPFPIDAQDMLASPGGKWSGGAHLWARPTRKGEWVELELPVIADGRYEVSAYLSRGPECGVIQIQVGGQLLGKPVDCFAQEGVNVGERCELSVVELKRGSAVLRIETTGTHEKSTGPRYAWGLDCVVLKPMK
jgi:hypothetical protein